MKINVKTAPKKFEPKTIEITLDTFEELKELRNGFTGYVNPTSVIGVLYRTINNQYKQSLEAGEVDYDF